MRIETNIPIYQPECAIILTTLRTMKYGDSVVADSEKKKNQIRNLAYNHGMKIKSHEIEKGVWRIWKIEMTKSKSRSLSKDKISAKNKNG